VEKEEVSLDEARNFAMDIGAVLRKTSAKNNIGVEDGFIEACKLYFKTEGNGSGKKSVNIKKLRNGGHEKKGKCC
jgi:hypothetical protein